MLKVLIGGDECSETGDFRTSKKLAVAKGRPTLLLNGYDLEPGQLPSKSLRQ